MTHNLLVYPSTLPGEPLERYEAHGVTLDKWLRDNVPSYQPGDQQPISATVNGVVVEPAQWAETYITRDTVVELRPQPQGASLIVAAVAAVVAVAATILLRPSIPSQSNRRSTRGSSIYEASAEGNRPKLGDVIPEIAGQHKTYPDYLTSPRRYFVNRTTQAIDLLLCVGRGEYAIPSGGIKIGSTPINSLGSDVNYQIFQPGQSVTSHQAHANWYNAPEVGASAGSSGLRLKGLSGGDRAFTGTINVNGSLFFDAPTGWEAGLEIARAYLWQPLTIHDGGGGNPDIIEGDFRHLSAGQTVRIEGISSLPDDYVITSHTDTSITLETLSGNPVANQTPGTYQASIDVAGARYLITERLDSPTGVRTDRLLPDGSPDPEWTSWPQRGVVQGELRVDPNSSPGFWSGPFLACPEGEVTSRIEFDILAPQGLGWIEDDGNIVTLNEGHDVELQWRAAGTSGWTSVIQSPTGKTRDQLGFTYAINLPAAITPEVRVRRVKAEAMATQALDKLEWYGLRCRLPAKTSYPGVTVIAMTITGSDTIASQTENQVSVVATRKLPVRVNGQWQPAQATRNIAPWIAYIAKSAGYTDDEIDYDELDRLDAIWRARGDYFDYVQDDDDTVKESLNRALRAGFAELTIDQGRIRPVRDEPRSTFEHMYTPQNMLDPLKRSVSAPRPDDADGVDVEYFDAETWTTETVECRLPGDQGFRAEKLRIEGVTNRTRAWRIGMRERRRQKYRRWTYSFSTELDALNSRYMSYCALADDIPGYAQSALVEGVEVDGPDVHLLSSEPLEWQTGKSHVIAWRRPDGTLAGPFPAQPGDDERHVIVQMDEVPVIDYQREPPHLLFGTTDEWSFPVLITSINPRGFESVSVDAVNYDERIYADDNGTPN